MTTYTNEDLRRMYEVDNLDYKTIAEIVGMSWPSVRLKVLAVGGISRPRHGAKGKAPVYIPANGMAKVKTLNSSQNVEVKTVERPPMTSTRLTRFAIEERLNMAARGLNK